MLLEFTVANYRSFREPVTLSLLPEARLSERDKQVDAANIAQTTHGDVLRVAAVYGANASGKSNLVRALWLLRHLVLNSAREGQSGDLLPVQPFRLDGTSTQEPTELEVVFLLGGRQLRFGVAATHAAVVREWLFVRDAHGEEQLGFEREGNVYTSGPAWERDEALERKTRAEALHISVAAAFNHPTALAVVGWFRSQRVVRGLSDQETLHETVRLFESQRHRAGIVDLVRRLDVGVEDVVVQDSELPIVEGDDPIAKLARGAVEAVRKLGPIKQLATLRRLPGGDRVAFSLEEESAGTAKAIALAGPVIDTLLLGGVLVVDEFDARLHTLLAMELVRLFQSPESNPRDAQLVFASHDTNLLTRSLLRRDQLWFVEKRRATQASDLYSLAEFRLPDGKRVRNDARYEVEYLQGRYGAIPFFGNLRSLLGAALAGRDDDAEA